MSEKRINKRIYWLSVACTEIILYSIILIGVSITCYGAFKALHLLPVVILATIIEVLSIWRKYMQGVYTDIYREYIHKEEGQDEF